MKQKTSTQYIIRVMVFLLLVYGGNALYKYYVNKVNGKTGSYDWSDTGTEKMRNVINFELKKELPLESDRRKVFDYVIGQLKAKYPDGIPSMDTTEAYQMAFSLGGEAFKKIPHITLAWNGKAVTQAKKMVAASDALSELDSIARIGYVDCFYGKLQTKYPAGFVDSIPEKISEKYSVECIQQVFK